MQTEIFALLRTLLSDPGHGWSIGSFGAIGEFMRDADEPVTITETPTSIVAVTRRGAIRIAPTADLTPVAWDSLSADGDSWGHEIGFCVPRPAPVPRTVRILGPDHEAIRPEDRDALLVDCGVGAGAVAMCVRTRDPAFIAALTAAEGKAYWTAANLPAATLAAQPQRVMLSPAGRIEIFQPIPAPTGKSPEGPHTHLIAKLVVKDRCHSSNVPIPTGMQAALSFHPRSPWRTLLGERHPFDAAADAAFAPLLARYGLTEDHAVHAAITAALDGDAPLAWPETRRARTKARITLRRRAALNDPKIPPWRALYDRAALDQDEGDDA